jgi:hypothetical protein
MLTNSVLRVPLFSGLPSMQKNSTATFRTTSSRDIVLSHSQ